MSKEEPPLRGCAILVLTNPVRHPQTHGAPMHTGLTNARQTVIFKEACGPWERGTQICTVALEISAGAQWRSSGFSSWLAAPHPAYREKPHDQRPHLAAIQPTSAPDISAGHAMSCLDARAPPAAPQQAAPCAGSTIAPRPLLGAVTGRKSSKAAGGDGGGTTVFYFRGDNGCAKCQRGEAKWLALILGH